MPRISYSINKNNQLKISKWIKTLKDKINNFDDFCTHFNDTILYEIKSIKECTQKSIVEYYIDQFSKYFEENETPLVYDMSLTKEIITPLVRSKLVAKYAGGTYDNLIDIYFNEVKKQYIMHPMNESEEIEFLPENRDIFIKNNLKLVVNCAKRYRGLGLPFEDLIQAGNLGLVHAFDNFDTSRSNLRSNIMKRLDESELENFSYDDAVTIVKGGFTYDKDWERTQKLIPLEGFKDRESFKVWITKNIKTAVFASVAFLWIRCHILAELNQSARVIKVPKSAMTKENGMPSIVYLDSLNPHTDDNYSDNLISETANEAFLVENDAIDKDIKSDVMMSAINKALSKLNAFDKRVVKKRFGIGFPCALSFQEIAESECIQVSKAKSIVNNALKSMKGAFTPEQKDSIYEMFV